MYWCVPYFEGHARDRARCKQLAVRHRREIMDAVVAGELLGSPLLRAIIRYDARCGFLVENFWAYLEALLRASTDRRVVQRLLIETCSAHAFRCSASKEKMRAIYELFRAHHDHFFYLDAFYHALPYVTQKSSLRMLMMDDLEKNGRAVASTGSRVLRQGGGYKRCNGFNCDSMRCKHCGQAVFGELFAALRRMRAEQ